MSVLIGADELAGSLDDVLVLDVRWKLGAPPGKPDYLAGHIPGAVYVDLDTELATHGAPTDGRHPLPSAETLQAAARRWGVRRDRPVVLYDDWMGMAAARAWWLLRWAGVEDVRILDGALPAWTGSLETGDVVPEPSDIVLEAGALPTLSLDTVGAFAQDGVLLDARAGERFRGEVEPMDPKAGHIPGARSAPTTDNLGPDGRFLAPDALRARFAGLGADGSQPVGVYCGSGISAAHEIVALELAGVGAALYAGSWSQWSHHDLPVAVGDG